MTQNSETEKESKLFLDSLYENYKSNSLCKLCIYGMFSEYEYMNNKIIYDKIIEKFGTMTLKCAMSVSGSYEIPKDLKMHAFILSNIASIEMIEEILHIISEDNKCVFTGIMSTSSFIKEMTKLPLNCISREIKSKINNSLLH